MAAKLDAGRAVLLVIDIQEAFRDVIPEFDQIAARAAILIEGAKVIGIPILVSEQYPRGLGETVGEVSAHLPDQVERFDKIAFSAAEADGFDLGGRDQAIVCGIEAHVCVNQTVLDLIDQGVEVHVVSDAVGSRNRGDLELGLGKAERSGAWLTSVETALFELLRRSGSDQFKRIQALIK